MTVNQLFKLKAFKPLTRLLLMYVLKSDTNIFQIQKINSNHSVGVILLLNVKKI